MKNSYIIFENILNGNFFNGSSKEEGLFYKDALNKHKDFIDRETANPSGMVKIRVCDLKPSQLKYYYYNDILEREIATVKKCIKECTYEFKTEKEVEDLIHRLQQEILNLSSQLINKFKLEGKIYNPEIDYSDKGIAYLAYHYLVVLSDYLESNYLKYIDKNSHIPCSSNLLKNLNGSEKATVVKTALSNTKINNHLLQVMYAPFIKLDSISFNDRITYKQLNYLSVYLNSFYDVIIQNNNKIDQDEIINILYEINYNSIEMFQYEIINIEEKLDKSEDDSQRIDVLYYTLKTINQRQSKQHFAFDPELPPLKSQLVNWIEEEISYRKTNIDLGPIKPSNDMFAKMQTKIATGLSVSQLACFYKLLVDTGLVSHKNQRDIFRHISECYSTSKVAQISLESISNKYYAIESSSISVIRGYLIEMLNITKDLI